MPGDLSSSRTSLGAARLCRLRSACLRSGLRAARLCLRSCLGAARLCRLRSGLRAARLCRLRSGLRAARLCLRSCLGAARQCRLRAGLRAARLCRLRSSPEPEASLRHHAETAALSAASGFLLASGLLTAALRRGAFAEALTTALRGDSESAPALTSALRGASGFLLASGLLTAALLGGSASAEAAASGLRLRSDTKPEPLRPALCHTKTKALRSALKSSGLLSAKGHLCVHDSGRSDSGEKDPGDCECKDLVHSSLLVLCCLRFFVLFHRATVPSV